MRWSYRCPRCLVTLNPGNSICLVAGRSTTRLIVAFDPEPGNYKVHVAPEARVDDGTEWHFFCPACHASLDVLGAGRLAALMRESDEESQTVYFSRVSGKEATVVVTEDGEQVATGDDVDELLEESMEELDSELPHLKYLL